METDELQGCLEEALEYAEPQHSKPEGVSPSFTPIVLGKNKGKKIEAEIDTKLLEIENKYFGQPFHEKSLDPNLVDEKSLLEEKTDRKKIRRRLILTNLFGTVLYSLRKGETIASLRGKRDFDLVNTGYLVLITEEKKWWGWKAVKGEKVKLGRSVLAELVSPIH
jgi:hypothetical protein